MLRAIAPLVVAVIGCAASRPAASGAKTTKPSPAPTAIASSSASTSPSTPAGDDGPCFRTPLTAAGYDAARDVVFLCDANGCLALGHDTVQASPPPDSPLAAITAPQWAPKPETLPAIVAAGGKVQRAGMPKAWAPVPAAKAFSSEALFTWANGARAIVRRLVAEPNQAAPALELLDLVDFDAHKNLDHAELCNYPIEVEAFGDASGHLARVQFFHDNPSILEGLVDLDRGRFVPLADPLPAKTAGPYDACPANDWTRYFDHEEIVERWWDATRRISGGALLSFEGKVVARLSGGESATSSVGDDVAKVAHAFVIDANAHLHVAFGGAGAGQACAAIVKSIPADAADPGAAPPRCVRLCEGSHPEPPLD